MRVPRGGAVPFEAAQVQDPGQRALRRSQGPSLYQSEKGFEEIFWLAQVWVDYGGRRCPGISADLPRRFH
eukprot:5770262-Pyramimonas_sp.AAC.1